MTNYRLLALDIDGTTLNSRGEVSPRLKAAIARARHAGILVTLATGRSLRAAQPVADELEISAPLILSNGALVIDPLSEQTLMHRPLHRSVAIQAARLLQRMGFMVCANRFSLHGPDFFYDQAPAAPEQGLMHRREPEYIRQVYDMAGVAASLDLLKIVTVDRTPVIERAAERLQLTLSGDFDLLVTSEAPGYSLLEVAPAGISKATGLERLANLNGILPHQIIAFGDNLNDLEMLRFAGMGVAMGNAPEAVKQAARMVTAANDDDGVAVFLEQYAFRAA